MKEKVRLSSLEIGVGIGKVEDRKSVEGIGKVGNSKSKA